MKTNKRNSINDYLTYFENRGIELGYFKVYQIKDIEKSCCTNAKTTVIDFDKIKQKLVADSQLNTIKSCDCMKIRPDKHCIDLIEMKGFVKLIDNFKKLTIDKEIDGKVAKFNFIKKIEDSLFIIDTLVRRKEFEKTLVDDIFIRDTKINYTVLTDVDSINESFNYIALNFIFYAEYSNSIENYITTKLETELLQISNFTHKLNKPTLITCSEIDSYYLND